MRFREKDEDAGFGMGYASGPTPEEREAAAKWAAFLETLPIEYVNSWGDKLTREHHELFDCYGNYRKTIPKKAMIEGWSGIEVTALINEPSTDCEED